MYEKGVGKNRELVGEQGNRVVPAHNTWDGEQQWRRTFKRGAADRDIRGGKAKLFFPGLPFFFVFFFFFLNFFIYTSWGPAPNPPVLTSFEHRSY